MVRCLGLKGCVRQFPFVYKGTNLWFSYMYCLLGGGGCDLVLGTQWLRTLGVIQWDFKLLTMCFTHGQKVMLLHGLKEAGSHIQEGNQFLKELVKRGLILQIACHTTANSTD